MRWLLIILPLCLIVAPMRPAADTAPRIPTPDVVIESSDALPSAQKIEEFAKSDPIAFLKACILRYQREVKGYQAVLVKQEFLGGKLHPIETVDVWFRDEPYSVMMRWRGECIGRADRALYVRGANGDQMLAHPKGRAARMLVGDVVSRDPDSAEARAASRYSLREAGIRKGTERTLSAWETAQKKGNLKVEFVGIKKVVECGDRPCYILRRTCEPPEDDGIFSVEAAFDVETWLQTGTLLGAADGRRLGAYHFRDVVLNPTFKPDQFERAALTRD